MCVLSSCSFVLCVPFLSSFRVVLSSLLFPVLFLCVSVMCLLFGLFCVLCCVCCLVCVCWVFRLCSVSVLLCVCVLPFLCVCSLVCVCCMCLVCVACVCYWSVLVCAYCACVSCVLSVCVLCVCCICVSIVSVFLCVLCVLSILCVSISLYVCICVYCVSVCLCSLSLLCMCLFSVLVLCLCCWLPCWCGVYHGGVMGACFWVWWFWFFGGCGVCEFFLFFYSGFLVGGRLLLGFCYRTFFCGCSWGLRHTRNFFKDITHSYYCCEMPVIGLYMCLLAHLYHTPHCSDIAPVYTCAPCLPLPVFVSICAWCYPRVSFRVALILCLPYTLSCVCLCL